MENNALRGACACGRNRYLVEVPQSSTQFAQVFFDNSSSSRLALAAPFTAWLKVPISWFHSQTVAFFPDETHRSIRRTFESPFESGIHRQFCGYCGTQLSRWDEGANNGEDFISLTLGSLFDEDLERLEELGLLEPEGAEEQEQREVVHQPRSQLTSFRPAQAVGHRGAPWFESMVEESALGRIKRRKGRHTSSDGSTQVEWEIVEWAEGDEDPGTPTKRKHGEMESDDIDMNA